MNSLIKLQEDECKKLIECELKMFKPKKVLFLTGLDWAEPFLENLQLGVKEHITSPSGYKCANISKEGIKYAITPHPQCKKEDELVEFLVFHLKGL